jgi:hypothetical protein
MNYWLQIATCALIFAVFLIFQFGDVHVYGITRLVSVFFEIAGPFAAFWLIILLWRGIKSATLN